jgi:hypothetical protein
MDGSQNSKSMVPADPPCLESSVIAHAGGFQRFA